jgi:hypothetical protein
MVTNYKNTITGFIELLGLDFNDPLVQARKATAPFDMVEMPDGSVGYAITYLGEAKVSGYGLALVATCSEQHAASVSHVFGSPPCRR